MSDEKRKVLEMLAAGKITEADAVRLLEALGEAPEDGENSQTAEGEEQASTSQQDQVPQDSEAPQDGGDCPKDGVSQGSKAPQGSSAPQEDNAPPQSSSQKQPGSGTDWAAVLEGLGASMDAAVNEAGQAAEAAFREAGKVMATAAKEAKEALKDGSFFGVVWPKGEEDGAPRPGKEDFTYEAPVGGPVDSLRVEWVSGPVVLLPWDGDTIRVAEYSNSVLTEENRMELREKNGRLTISWSGKKAVFGKIRLKKRLVIELPRDAFLQEVKVETVSGPVELQNFAAGHLQVETVSGAVRVWGSVEEASLQTVSGELWFTGEKVPQRLKLNSVSGSLSVTLPQGETGFTVEYSSVSGRFTSQFPLTGKLNGHDGRAVWGDGTSQVRMDTVSGALELRVAQH
ncbi:MAG: DUF4097 family beta strand repeat-containing protein [Acutalibacter sp.]|jgi:hypothetical protein